MDIKNLIENKYMKYVLQINVFSGPRPRVPSSRRVGSGLGLGVRESLTVLEGDRGLSWETKSFWDKRTNVSFQW